MPPDWVIVLKDLGPGGLVTLIVVLVLTGRLVPRQLLVDKQAEANDWKQAYQLEAAASSKTANQLDLLLDYSKTTDMFIRSVKEHATRVDPDSGDPT